MFSSSYPQEGLDLLTNLVRIYTPVLAIECGTQQGTSAVAIARGLDRHSKLITCDTFQTNYSAPPHSETHANKQLAEQNLKNAELCCKWEVVQSDADQFLDQHLGNTGLVHIDICNHLDNAGPLIKRCAETWNLDCIILEGGIPNRWITNLGLHTYTSMLSQFPDWTYITIPFNSHNSMTIMTRR